MTEVPGPGRSRAGNRTQRNPPRCCRTPGGLAIWSVTGDRSDRPPGLMAESRCSPLVATWVVNTAVAWNRLPLRIPDRPAACCTPSLRSRSAQWAVVVPGISVTSPPSMLDAKCLLRSGSPGRQPGRFGEPVSELRMWATPRGDGRSGSASRDLAGFAGLLACSRGTRNRSNTPGPSALAGTEPSLVPMYPVCPERPFDPSVGLRRFGVGGAAGRRPVTYVPGTIATWPAT
jgi:hypothetical protein